MKRVLLVPDVPNWIWHTKSLSIQRHLRGVVDIDIFFYPTFAAAEDELTAQYDEVLAFPWYADYKHPERLLSAICSFSYQRMPTANLRKFKRLCCVSPQLLGIFHAADYANLALLMNGVEEDYFTPAPIPHEGFRILMVGKACARNNLPFYAAVSKALAPYSDITVTWMRNDIRDALPFDQMPAVYNSHDLYFHIARNEGTPNCLFEAAACGLPCVSNWVGCAPELLERAYIADTVSGFVDAILGFYRDRDKAWAVGARNRQEILNHWTWRERAQQYAAFLGA